MNKQMEIKLNLDSLCVYKWIFNKNIGDKFRELVDKLQSNEEVGEIIKAYNDFAFELFSSKNSKSFKETIVHEMLVNNNPFYNNLNGEEVKTEYLLQCLKSELNYLEAISKVNSITIKEILAEKCTNDILLNRVNGLINWGVDQEKYVAKSQIDFEVLKEKLINNNNWADFAEEIINFHKVNGTGRSTAYRAFVWERFENEEEGHLREVAEPDPITLKELVGYEFQKKDIIRNTEQFLKGIPANNLLLYGSRGTGKSSTVKAILNEYYNQGLRLIEVDKEQLGDFTRIIRLLKNKKQKFIIFVDDLVFAENEQSYSALKTILEGRVENRPDNIIIYATTNRRHLVKEKFSDRDDVHSKDTKEEQLSLADRFGMTISFYAPNQNEFLDIVDGIVEYKGIEVDRDYLHSEALKWEKWNNGRSPRSARQFINWLEGELAMNK